MNEILCLLHPTRPEMVDAPTDAETAAVRAHFQHLQAHLARGTVRVAGRTDGGRDTFGIVVYRAAPHAEAVALAHDDPAVRAGVMTAQTFPFRTALIEGDTP